MGLHIIAYSGLKRTEPERDQFGDGSDPDMCRIWKLEEHFPGMADEFEYDTYYLHEAEMSFRAGPYSVYSMWRNELARMAEYPPEPNPRRPESAYVEGAWGYEEGEFIELLYFSDCEGALGTATSAKLAADFAEFDDLAKSHVPITSAGEEACYGKTWFYDLYTNFRKAFELASDRGAVRFT